MMTLEIKQVTSAHCHCILKQDISAKLSTVKVVPAQNTRVSTHQLFGVLEISKEKGHNQLIFLIKLMSVLRKSYQGHHSKASKACHPHI